MIKYVFGSPGCGKSCLVQKIICDNQKKKQYKYVYTNDKFNGSRQFKYKDFGYRSFPEGSLIIIDEAGIEANNRMFSNMPIQVIEYLKKHRHYKVDIIVISQDFEDVDITFRRLANEWIYVKKLPFITLLRPVRKFVRVDKESEQIIYGYKFSSLFDIRAFVRYNYYYQYESYETDNRPSIHYIDNKFVKLPIPKKIVRTKAIIYSCLLVLFIVLCILFL